MGVITKNERKLQIKPAESEETLYIPSSDDERSEASVAVRHAQARILPRHRPPTVGAAVGTLKPQSGKKKSRRYQNVSQLVTLAEEDELREVTIEDFVEPSRTPFSVLLEDENSLQIWEAFVGSSEETQRQLIHNAQRKVEVCSPQKRAKLSTPLRSLLKKRSLPLGMVQHLEGELIQFFSQMPRDTYVSPKLSSFERLLLHNLSDYHSLVSLSFDKEPEKVRLVRVKNPRDEFPTCPLLLTDYLASLSTPS